jgi:hypothetical protein
MAMKRELFNKWISALRSGNYEQGTGFLCRNDKFCCLGVLLDVAKEPYETNMSGLRFYFGEIKAVGALSDSAVKKYGFKTDCGGSYIEGGTSLVNLNDTIRKPFDKIADILENNPEAYVKIED